MIVQKKDGSEVKMLISACQQSARVRTLLQNSSVRGRWDRNNQIWLQAQECCTVPPPKNFWRCVLRHGHIRAACGNALARRPRLISTSAGWHDAYYFFSKTSAHTVLYVRKHGRNFTITYSLDRSDLSFRGPSQSGAGHGGIRWPRKRSTKPSNRLCTRYHCRFRMTSNIYYATQCRSGCPARETACRNARTITQKTKIVMQVKQVLARKKSYFSTT